MILNRIWLKNVVIVSAIIAGLAAYWAAKEAAFSTVAAYLDALLG